MRAQSDAQPGAEPDSPLRGSQVIQVRIPETELRLGELPEPNRRQMATDTT